MIATNASQSNHLATIDERPDAVVVIYDGHCRFCTSQVRNLAKWDTRGRLAFISLHDERVASRYPDLTHEQMMEQLYLIPKDGRRYGGAAAFRYLTRFLPRLWVFAPALHFPFSLPVWQWGYRQVAKRRYLMGKTEACEGDVCEVHFK